MHQLIASFCWGPLMMMQLIGCCWMSHSCKHESKHLQAYISSCHIFSFCMKVHLSSMPNPSQSQPASWLTQRLCEGFDASLRSISLSKTFLLDAWMWMRLVDVHASTFGWDLKTWEVSVKKQLLNIAVEILFVVGDHAKGIIKKKSMVPMTCSQDCHWIWCDLIWQILWVTIRFW